MKGKEIKENQLNQFGIYFRKKRKEKKKEKKRKKKQKNIRGEKLPTSNLKALSTLLYALSNLFV